MEELQELIRPLALPQREYMLARVLGQSIGDFLKSNRRSHNMVTVWRNEDIFKEVEERVIKAVDEDYLRYIKEANELYAQILIGKSLLGLREFLSKPKGHGRGDGKTVKEIGDIVLKLNKLNVDRILGKKRIEVPPEGDYEDRLLRG